MFQPVSLSLQQGIRFLRHLDPDLQQHALRLACLPLKAKAWGATFRIIDPMDDLGASSTPMVPQFRAGS